MALEESLFCAQAKIVALTSDAPAQAPPPTIGAPDAAAVQASPPPVGAPDAAAVQAPPPPVGEDSLPFFQAPLPTISPPISPYVRNSPMTATRTTPTNSTSEPPMPSSTTSASLARKPRRRRRKRSKLSSIPKPFPPTPTILHPPLYYYSSDFLAHCPMGPGHHSFAWVEALRCWSSPRYYSFPPLLEVPPKSGISAANLGRNR